jgi:hypothetical protein
LLNGGGGPVPAAQNLLSTYVSFPQTKSEELKRSGSGLDVESMVSFFDRRRKPFAGFSPQFEQKAVEVVPGRSS